MVVDVQGYFTTGDDPAAGGYVSVTPTRVVNTTNGTGLPQAALASGSTATVTIAGTAGVPSGASAVFANVATSDFSGNNGFITAYASDQPRPTASLNYPDQATTSFGTTIPLGADGKINIYVSQGPIHLYVDVFGYYSGSTTSGAFTPAVAAVAKNVALTNATTKAVQVTGIAGVPVAGSGISSVAMNISATNAGSDGGYIQVWASGTAQPGTTALNLPHTASTVTNFVTTRVGGDGRVNLYTSSTSISVTLTVSGWYTNTGAAISNDQSQTQQSVTLQADATGGGPWVTYQYRVGAVGGPTSFVNVPPANAKDGSGNRPSAWPVTTSGGKFTPYAWNIRDTLAAIPANNNNAPDSLIQVQACYGSSSTDNSLACGMPSNVNFSQSAFGDGYATSDLGPGTLSEVTGDYRISAADAAAADSLGGGLTVGRTFTTLTPANADGAAGVFGPGWNADLAGPDAGDGDLTVTDQTPSGYLLFTNADGGVWTYEATSDTGTYPISFTGVADAAGDGQTVAKSDANTILMTDPDNTVTTWTMTGSTWRVTSVKEAGSDSTATYSYDNSGRVTRILAPTPAGVDCSTPDTAPGCRSLTLNYQTVSTSGGNVVRLRSVKVSLPQTIGASNLVTVALFDYDTSGRLADSFDPRITPYLKTAYTYNAAGRLATLTSPGLSAWSFGYDSTGRVSNISQPDPSGATAVTTVVYDVPTTGSSAPIALDASTTGQWDETSDLPVTGTAIFFADHKPAGTTPGLVATADWPYAGIDYLDVNGQPVNTAQYGAGAWQIDTTQYDTNGNDVWDLSAGNRAQALTPTSATDPYVAGLISNVARASALAETVVYSPLDSSLATDTYGPAHPVTLTNGTVIDGRAHDATTYDEGAPNADVSPLTGTAYDLPTTDVSSEYNIATATDSTFPDATTTRTGYDPIVGGDSSGWTLGQPTSSTVQMAASPSSADLSSYTRYDSAGRTIETRLPGDSGGTGPRTSRATYYAAGANGSCGSNTLAGLICSSGPVGQPGTGNPLPVTSYSYDQYGDPLTTTETYGSGGSPTVRTTTVGYDLASRPTSQNTTVTPVSAGGTSLPTVNYGYNSSTGRAATTTTGAGAGKISLTVGYDALGRQTSYTDATGNTSTIAYDLDGRVTAENDGKGTTSYTYDSSTEHRGLITSENIGVSGSPSTFAASYDPNGNLTTENYPNGLAATTGYDNADNPTALTYAKSGSTWMRFTATIGDQDRTVAQTSPQSNQTFAYDQADRLTGVQDTYQNSCTTRTYSFDTHSNRTALKSYPAGSGGACSTTASPTITNGSYDQADRDTNTGYTYDQLGRTLDVPAIDAQGTGAHAPTVGNLAISYYANDMVASQAQSTVTQSFTLDPMQSRISAQSDGTATTTNHYTDDTDSPAWISTGSNSWTRNVGGPDGGLAVSTDQLGNATLQLRNLHGDIVAQCDDLANASDIRAYGEATEFGTPRSLSTSQNYNYLGSKQRSTNDLGGLTLMGARLYDTQTGRFESRDPVAGGNANSYIYPADPVNNDDASGQKLLPIEHAGRHGTYLVSPGGHLVHVNRKTHLKVLHYHNLFLRVVRAALRLTSPEHEFHEHGHVWIYEPRVVLKSCGVFGCENQTIVTLHIAIDYGYHRRHWEGRLISAYCVGYHPRCPDIVNTAY